LGPNFQEFDMHTFLSKRFRPVAAVFGTLCIAATMLGTTAHAADVVGTSYVFGPEAGATLSGELISWQGEVLANKTTNGFTAFNISGAAVASPINVGAPVKTMAIFNNLLTWVDTANNVKTSNPGGTVTALGTVSATANQLLGVGPQLWVARAGGVDRYGPSGSTLGGASVITLSAGSSVRMAVATDGNVWIVEKTGGVDTLTRWSPLGAPVGAAYNFANSAADPAGIVAGPDGAVWIILAGTNSIARVDSTNAYAEFPLPAGAVPAAIAAGADGVWITENGLNNVAKLSYAAGAFSRTTFAAQSAFGLKGLIVGPDANVWTVGTNVNKVAKFGTMALPTTTIATTTTTPATTTAATTVAPTTKVIVPPTVAPTLPPTFPPQKVCVKTAKRRVKVNGRFKTVRVCVKYVTR
jgi:streptogramin lyase